MVKRISLAEVRRRLPVGAKFTAEFIGLNAKVCKPENRCTKRVVEKQTSHQMVSVKEDGERVWHQWNETMAHEHEDGSIVLSMTDGDESKKPEAFLRITLECPHYEDNQGFCHKCGVLMNEDRAYASGYHPDQQREEAGAGGEYPRQNLSSFV